MAKARFKKGQKVQVSYELSDDEKGKIVAVKQKVEYEYLIETSDGTRVWEAETQIEELSPDPNKKTKR